MGSGGGKKRTGVSLVDDAADTVDRTVQQGADTVSRAVNQVMPDAAKGLPGMLVGAPLGVEEVVKNITTQVGNGVRDVGNYLVNGQAGRDVGKLSRNVERNLQGAAKGTALMLKGDFTNADRTLLDTMSLGTTTLINPEEKSKIKQTPVERMEKQAEEDAEQVSKEIKEAEVSKRIQSVNNTIAGIIGAQRRSPGRASTLLTSSSGGRY